MTARTEIEHRHLYYKRRNSCSGVYGKDTQKARCATSVTLEGETSFAREEEMIRSRPPSSRVKSTSICVGAMQLEGERRLTSQPPRTLNDFQFLNPELLTMQNYELQTIRPPALSTSEIFCEPPPVYIYRVVPPHQRNSLTSKKPPNKVIEYMKRRKHTLIAWSFGIFAVCLCITVVVLQCKTDFK